MAHKQQFDFVNAIKYQYPDYFNSKRVVEIGSLDINGSIRSLFNNCDYTGVDVGEGRGVDIVCSGHLYNAPDNSLDVAISCECFEHNPHWKETFINMHRMTRPGGLVIVSCATKGRGEHGTTRTSPNDSPLTIGCGWEYYKNLYEQDFYDNFDMDNMFKAFFLKTEHRIDFLNDLYFFGIKGSY